ncbi:MAG: argininosuccinate lyase [Xylanivirga thermophila]|jgi:argininosuccinate lyase|uniref:argininosuccinate lyase n=1 Tax=Xylanivirga thermophila TaxID=2496273 RepID=UPI0039F4B5CB
MKLWGGRFQKETVDKVNQFNSSINFDYKLYKQDIYGSIAHVHMLAKQHIISQQDSISICDGLMGILNDIEDGKIQFDSQAEDIHSNIESLLIERIGDVGKKLHTGRSRNDQVALDTRMYVKDQTKEIIYLLIDLEKNLLSIANGNKNSIMPGYTHMQKAQPITLSHHILAYFEMFKRDIERLNDSISRVDVLPLGSGALATTTYPLDRYMVANKLGFKEISSNSLDAVSDRDFVIELLSCCSIIMMHLSRFSEELILWSTDEFGFIELDDGYSTGSSIMPQKKNPDVLELIRGKTGRVYGNLIAMLTIMKGLPLAYNKDMQEDKEALFDTVDTVKNCIDIFNCMITTTTFNTQNMLNQAAKGYINATDAADYLVKKGLPFRDAHKVIGHLVLYAMDQNKTLNELSKDEFKSFSPMFDEDILDTLSLDKCVNERKLPGGPAPVTVEESIKRGYKWIEKTEELLI